MIKSLSVILMMMLTSCHETKDRWHRQSSNFRDRGLLFMFYGNETLDQTAEKSDLFWGQSVTLPTFFILRPKPEHLISECVLVDKKLFSQFGNITFVKNNNNCLEGSLFDDYLLSNKKGGSEPSQALIIPTIENHFEIFDDLYANSNSKWFRLRYQQKAKLLIEASSFLVLDGRLYFDRNKNEKIEKDELIDVLTVDDKPQQIDTELEPGTYFFQVTNDTTEIPIDPLTKKNQPEQDNKSSTEEGEVYTRTAKPQVTEGLKFSDHVTSTRVEQNYHKKRNFEAAGEKTKSTFTLRFTTKYSPGYADMGGGDHETAFNLKMNDGSVSVNDSIGMDDQVDFYKFDLEEPRSIRIKLDTLAGLGDADLELYRDLNADGKTSDDELVKVSEGTGVDSLSIPFAAQGTWYVKIVAYQGELTYHLEVITDETHSADLGIVSERTEKGLSFEILNKGPSDAKDVKVNITLSDGQQILTEYPLTKRDGTGNYLIKFGQISKGEKPTFTITGESGSVVMVEVESKLPDSDTSNNALVKKI